jgi:hypothetical protein
MQQDTADDTQVAILVDSDSIFSCSWVAACSTVEQHKRNQGQRCTPSKNNPMQQALLPEAGSLNTDSNFVKVVDTTLQHRKLS